MSLLSKPGRYLAFPESWGIKHEEGKCPRFAMVFRCTEDLTNGDSEAVEGEQRITGFFTLMNRDNSPNEINLNALHDALGWDGQSFSALDTNDWSTTQVQVVVQQGEYNGEKRLEVKYLNPKTYSGGGGIDKADPQVVQSLDVKYGSMLRAVFKKNGAGSNGNGAGKATAPPVTRAPIAASDPANEAKQSAWLVFKGKTTEYADDKRIAVFKRIVGEIVPTKQPREFVADDWKHVAERVESDFSAATEELVPF